MEFFNKGVLIFELLHIFGDNFNIVEFGKKILPNNFTRNKILLSLVKKISIM